MIKFKTFPVLNYIHSFKIRHKMRKREKKKGTEREKIIEERESGREKNWKRESGRENTGSRYFPKTQIFKFKGAE